MIIPDLPEFQLQNGVVISGRKAYNAYCKEHNVTNPADFKQEWAKKAEERQKLFTPGSGYDRERRIEALKHAWEKNSGRR